MNRTLLIFAFFISLLAQASKTMAAEGFAPAPQKQFIGTTFLASDADLHHPVYESAFDNPAALKDWTLEGGLKMSVESGKLVLESQTKSGREETDDNHLVCWLKKEVPGDFLLEFTVRPANRNQGLNIVFFSTRARGGQSIFDPTLAPRNGAFPQYHSGELNGYHISYWAAGRGTANVRKNFGFHLVAEGRDLVTPGAGEAFQTVRIYKRAGKIRCAVDGIVSVAYDDDGKAFGPVWTHSGWIGLRQMGHTARCEYGHVNIWPLLAEKPN